MKPNPPLDFYAFNARDPYNTASTQFRWVVANSLKLCGDYTWDRKTKSFVGSKKLYKHAPPENVKI